KSTQPFRRQANPWQQQQGGSDNESDEDIALSSRGALTSDNLREGFDKPSDTSLKRYVYSVATTPGPEPATPYFGGKTQQPQPLPLPPPPSLPPSLDDFAYDSTTMTQGTGGEQPPADVDTTDLTPSHQASASYHSQGNQAYAPPAVTDNNNNNHLQQQQQYVHHLEMQVSGSDTSLISGSSSTSNADAPLTPETPKDGEPLQQYLFQSITFSEEMTKSLRHIEEKASRAKHGIISVHEIGQVKQLAAEAASTAIDRGDTEDRPTTALPPYITPINELPQNGLFVLPPPKVTLGNLYLKIICMDKIQLSREVLQNVESFYFVIRNGLNKHVCDLFPANISAVGGRDNPDEVVIHINQQFRIAVNPLQSVTLHLRMRYRPGYIPPRLRSMDQQQQQPKSGLASDEKRAPKPKKLTRPTGSCPPPFNLFNLAFSKGVSPANSIIADAANSSIASIASNHGCLPRLGRLMRKNTRSSNHSMSSGESAEITTTFDYRHNYSDQITVHNANERRRANTAPSMPPAPPQQQATDPGSTRKVVDSLSPVDAIHYNDQAFPPNPSRHDGRSLWYPASEIFTPIMVQIQPNEPASRIPVHHVGKVYEETIGVASVYVESMIDEVYLRTLTDTWDVEYVYGKEGITICRLHFQLFFIPISPELYLDDLPRSIDECADDMWIHFWHSSVYTNGFLSQCGGDTSFWRRRYYKLIGAYLVVYSENTRNVRVLIDLSMATKIADNSLALPPTAGSGEAGGPAEARMLANGITPLDRPRKAPPGVGSFLFNPPPPGVKRRMTKHGVSRADAQHRKRNAASPQPPGMLPIQPILMQGSQGGLSSQSANSSDHDIAFINTSLQSIYGNVSYSFSVQFGHSGWIEFYADTAEEQRKWVRAITKVMEGIPELPTWILKMARAECAGAFPAPLMNVASSK
ncbi:Bud site selection protein bud4, partial [Spiromyces aspiralis]